MGIGHLAIAGGLLLAIVGCGTSSAQRPTLGANAFRVGVPVSGAPDPADPAFLSDQDGLYDAAQFSNHMLYPPGFHWRLDPKLTARNLTSVNVGIDGPAGDAVFVMLDAAGGAEWLRITTAAYHVYQSDTSARPVQAEIAIFVGKEIVTTPVVTGVGQSNGLAISGITRAQAHQIADDISSAIDR